MDLDGEGVRTRRVVGRGGELGDAGGIHGNLDVGVRWFGYIQVQPNQLAFSVGEVTVPVMVFPLRSLEPDPKGIQGLTSSMPVVPGDGQGQGDSENGEEEPEIRVPAALELPVSVSVHGDAEPQAYHPQDHQAQPRGHKLCGQVRSSQPDDAGDKPCKESHGALPLVLRKEGARLPSSFPVARQKWASPVRWGKEEDVPGQDKEG